MHGGREVGSRSRPLIKHCSKPVHRGTYR
uniref:Uncharacterized protein n=1 Tax=Anguilla anguilla TaxID=7936 RepID=A0A0E9PZD4_ANGAN